MPQLFPIVEIVLDHKANTLCVQGIAGEVSVIGLIVDAYTQIAVGYNEVADVEVADKRLVSRSRIVAVAELSVEEKTVVEETAAENTLVDRKSVV